MAILHAHSAQALLRGGLTTNGAFSQRSVINLGFLFDNSYPFINHYLFGDSSTSPVGSAFSTGTTWPALIDANGWPNQPGVSGTSFGGSVRIAGSDEYTGKWVISWDGDGRVSLGVGTWTVDAASSSNYVQNSNGNYSNATFGVGSSPRIVVTLSAATGPQLVGVVFQSTDPNGVGAYLHNFKFYRLTDETDLLAGKVFRAGFKQSLVNLNPAAVRFLNWHGSSDANNVRFENRTVPNTSGYSYNTNWTSSPSYGATSGTNIYTLAAATPTTSNPKTTPVSLTHGEIVVCRFTNGSVRGGRVSISSITNANPGKVTTSAAHGFLTGDQIVHYTMVGMNQLNYFPVTITVLNSTQYTIGVDTTSYGAFTSGFATEYLSIDVGGRGARPMAFTTGADPATIFGDFITAGMYTQLWYDKNVAILGDGAGNLSYGAWVAPQNNGGWRGDMPVEICTALVNELNALSVAQGINTPINMWLNIPHPGLTSMDSDYSSGSDFALNTVGAVLNGANGFSGLTANAKLFVEYSNETWNFGGGFKGTFYLCRMGNLRWPTSGTTDAVDMHVLRSTIVMRTIKATYGSSRIKYVLAGAGFFGYAVGGLYQARVMGSSTPSASGNFYTTDTLTVNGSFGTPISNHDAFCTATYFDADGTYYTGTGAGSFTDDSAMYAGTSPYSSPNQAQAITNFVAAVKSGPGQSIDGYLNNSLSGLTATYAAAMQALGKTAINYEGGPDWPTAVGDTTQGGHTLTSADSTFVIAALDSTQWRDAQVNYFNRTSQVPGSAMPSVYTFIGASLGNQRWAYCNPDSYGGTATEGQGLLNSPVWVGMGARNQALA